MAWDLDEIEELEARTVYTVVVNDEGQYSIWPADRTKPSGWRDAGKIGSKKECLDFIDETWIDMRPLSLQKRMSGT
jgi:MbtH protein